jgi:hypothetical protein
MVGLPDDFPRQWSIVLARFYAITCGILTARGMHAAARQFQDFTCDNPLRSPLWPTRGAALQPHGARAKQFVRPGGSSITYRLRCWPATSVFRSTLERPLDSIRKSKPRIARR